MSGHEVMMETSIESIEDRGRGAPSRNETSSIGQREMSFKVDTLAKMIAYGDTKLEVLATEWLRILRNDQFKAYNILFEMFSESAGYIEDRAQNQEVPVLISFPVYQQNLSIYLKNLMTPDVINEMSFMGRFTNKIIEMSKSTFKSLRFTAVVVAAQIISSLLVFEEHVEFQITLLDQRNEEFRERIKEKEYIYSHWNNLVYEIIRTRTRDIEWEIRRKTIQSLLKWILKHPDKMANDGFLKYINRSLSDTKAAVRLFAVEATMKIVQKINNLRILGLFLKNCVPKLSLRINDVHSTVGKAAIEALYVIDSCFEGMLSSQINEEIYIQVYSMDINLSRAAGRFLSGKLSGEINDEENSLQALIQFHFESPQQGSGEFFISAIFKQYPFLTNWENWIKCISNESDEKKKEISCQLLVHTIKLAATGNSPPWPTLNLIVHPQDKNKTNEEEELTLSLVEQKKHITKYFSKRITTLLKKYEDNPNCLKYFLAIPQYLNCFSDPVVMMPIIDEIYRLALQTEDKVVIHNCFYHLTAVSNNIPAEWSEFVLIKQKCLEMQIVNEFFCTAVNIILSEEMINELDEKLLINFERALAFARFFNLTNTPVADLALKALQLSIQRGNNEGVKIFANICYHNALWKLNEIVESFKVLNLPAEEDSIKLKTLGHELWDCVIKILSLDFSEDIKCMAFKICSELLTLFSIRNVNLKNLPFAVINPTRNKLERIVYFIRTSVPVPYESDVIKCRRLNSKCLLLMYCKLLGNFLIPTSGVANILPYFQSTEYRQILNFPLKSLLSHKVTTKSAVTAIVYGLEVLLQHCQKGKFSEKELQNVIDGLVEGLSAQRNDLENPIQEIQFVGLEIIFMSKNIVFFIFLRSFIALIQKPRILVTLKNTVNDNFHHYMNENPVKLYLKELDHVTHALKRVDFLQRTTTAHSSSDSLTD